MVGSRKMSLPAETSSSSYYYRNHSRLTSAKIGTPIVIITGKRKTNVVRSCEASSRQERDNWQSRKVVGYGGLVGEAGLVYDTLQDPITTNSTGCNAKLARNRVFLT